MVAVNHYFWFSHFSSLSLTTMPKSLYDASPIPTFIETSSFFGIFVWLVPFALFVSLSASDNVLPTMGSEVHNLPDTNEKSRRLGMVKVMVDTVRKWITELGIFAGWWRSGGEL